MLNAIKPLILISSILTFSANAENKINPICNDIADLAKAVMTARQNNVDIKKLYDAANGIDGARNMVTVAYSKPRFKSEEYKQNAITDFSNNFFLACVKLEDKKKI